jgi:hypothetical protein
MRRVHAKSDLLGLLKAIGAYEFDGCRDSFCFANGLNAKTMREIHALRAQLVRIIRAVGRSAPTRPLQLRPFRARRRRRRRLASHSPLLFARQHCADGPCPAQTCPEKAEQAEIARAPPSPRQESVIRQVRRGRSPPGCECRRSCAAGMGRRTRFAVQIITAGLIDHVARKSLDTSLCIRKEKQPAYARSVFKQRLHPFAAAFSSRLRSQSCVCLASYFCTVTNTPVYIHPRSSLMASPPEWIVRALPRRLCPRAGFASNTLPYPCRWRARAFPFNSTRVVVVRTQVFNQLFETKYIFMEGCTAIRLSFDAVPCSRIGTARSGY